MGKYFTVTKKIEIAASLQHAAFSAGEVIADWQAIQIPKGSACLRSITMLVRPKGDATPTDNNVGADILFSKTNTVSLGTVGAAAAHNPNPDILGMIEFEAGNYGSTTLQSTAIATTSTQGDTEAASVPLVLEGNPISGDNVGYDTVYMGVVARGTFDFRTIIRLNDASGNMDVSVAGTTIATDGSGMDIREHFAAGDILHANDDAVIGTVSSVTDATDLELTSNFTAGALADDDFVYNLHPITLVLGFEK